MLVNIYGSRDMFVSEYRTLLADRILSSFNYDIAKEVSLKYDRLLGLKPVFHLAKMFWYIYQHKQNF
jgi:anaphase-promoting complex subunit 2